MQTSTQRKATLTLQDGSTYTGWHFGATRQLAGEVVFNTAMNGYTESLTDPSYMGQILVMTYPMVGNYGIPAATRDEYDIPRYYESDGCLMRALIVNSYSPEYSHWNAEQSLGDFMAEQGVVGITGIDTRALTKHLRDHGIQVGTITIEGETSPIEPAIGDQNLVAQASCPEPRIYGSGDCHIALIDCGLKDNILRSLIDERFTLHRVPWDYPLEQIEGLRGVFISNGPGSPTCCKETIRQIQYAFERQLPTYGICMGNQLMALASGAKIYKMKYGNHGHNQPVRRVNSTQCLITSQNHSYAVNSATLPQGWEEWYTNLNDGTNEGLMHTDLPFRSVQFHPEAKGGPLDALSIFSDFQDTVLNYPQLSK